MVDRKGQPLTDPRRSKEGILLPIGGYKGYGLNVVIGMLAGVLNGASFGRNVVDFDKDLGTPCNGGHMIFAMRVDNFRSVDDFKREMDRSIREIRNSERMPRTPEARHPHRPGRCRAAPPARYRDGPPGPVGLIVFTVVVWEG
jgi:LDH2 family malate/lactate/ureidoglycolate dehydrogenase